MVALTADRGTLKRPRGVVRHPVAAGVRIHAGSLVLLDAAGNATPGKTATNHRPGGVAICAADNRLGAAGDMSIDTDYDGWWRFTGQGVTRAHVGGDAYVVDDQTVAPTDGTGTRSKIGRIVDVDVDGVWIEVS